MSIFQYLYKYLHKISFRSTVPLSVLFLLLPVVSFSKTTTIQVGIYNNAPIVFEDSNGEVDGLFVDILEAIAEKEQWKLQYKIGHFAELFQDLKEGKIDLLPAVAYSHEREQFIDYNFETVMSNWAELYTQTNDVIKSMLDLQGKKIAVKRGDIHLHALRKMMDSFDIECRFFETDEYLANFEMLRANYVDVAVVNRLFGMRNKSAFGLQQTQIIFNPIELRFAVPKGTNTSIIGALDSHLTQFKADVNSIYYSSVNRWFALETKSSVPKWLLHLLYTVIGIALFLSATVLIFQQQVKNRTKQLERTNVKLRSQVEEKEKAEGTLKKFARIVEASSDGMALVDKQHRHVLANQTYRDTVHFNEDAIEGIPLQTLLGSSFFKEELEEAVTKCLTGKIVHVQTRPSKEHSNNRYWNLTLSPYYSAPHELDGYVLDIRDVTDQVKLQNRLKNSQKMEAIGMLAGGVAHDLNNILSGLVSYPDMLLINRAVDDPMTKPLQTIKKSGKRAAVIVQDLLTLARRGVDHPTPVNLNNIVDDFITSPEYDDILRDIEGVECIIDLEENLTNMQGSTAHLTKLLMNLFINGIEAMTEGGSLTIQTRNASLIKEQMGYELIPPGEYTTLAVTDTGVGMTTAELNRVFEPFYTNKVLGRSGTGLGMAVVWGSVKDHHGYIDIKSKPGQGTSFKAFFPISQATIPETETISLDKYQGNSEKILVIDDLEEQRTLGATILNNLGYIADVATSGEEAVKKCNHEEYDLLILDMIMPGGIDGLTTFEQILAIKPDQKAIIASGFSENSRVKKAQEIGAGSYIKKPYTIEVLAEAIHQELGPKCS